MSLAEPIVATVEPPSPQTRAQAPADARERREEAQAARLRRLERARRIQAEVTAACAHQLRAQLSAAERQIERVVEATSEAELAGAVSALRAETRRIGERLDEMMRAWDDGRDPMAPRPLPIDAGALLRACREALSPVAEAAGVALALAPPAELVEAEVTADREQLGSALLDLIAESLARAPEGGRVTLRAVAEPRTVRIEIDDGARDGEADLLQCSIERADEQRADEGGMLQRNIERGVAEPARHRQPRRLRSAAGLGLSFARRIVERLGGSLLVARAPGEARFTLSLPRADAPGPLRRG